jgi:hypothetical protein
VKTVVAGHFYKVSSKAVLTKKLISKIIDAGAAARRR